MKPVRSLSALVASCSVAIILAGCAERGEAVSRQLRICSDPNNLPFSNQRRQGFENHIAEVLSDEMGAQLSYTWAPQWRGFIRKTLGAGECDVVMGLPTGFERALTTSPYYSSTYVFVWRKGSGPPVRSLDDTVLRRVKVGVHLIGDDYTNPPPVHALARRGITDNVVGYPIYGDYSKPNPPARIIESVAGGEVDVAVVWGPFAGYFAGRQKVPLEMAPVVPALDPPGLPFVFDISLGVRHGDVALRDELDSALQRRRQEIDRILHQYGVPLARPELGAAREPSPGGRP